MESADATNVNQISSQVYLYHQTSSKSQSFYRQTQRMDPDSPKLWEDKEKLTEDLNV